MYLYWIRVIIRTSFDQLDPPKGGQVDCMEVVLCLSQKVAKNGQILSMFVPKKWLFSLLLQPHQGWLFNSLFKSKNWLMSKICQPLSLVSGFLRSYWFGLLHCHIMDTERSSQPLSLIQAFWVIVCLCFGFS